MARFYQFGYLPKLTCLYRVHDTNMTGSVTWQKRKRQLLAGRRKILASDWFGQISVPARREFFKYVLVDLLGGDPAMQQEILDTPQFQALPPVVHTDLHRTIAVADLVEHGDIAHIRAQLQLAVAAWPEDRKSRALLVLSSVSVTSCRAAVRCWSTLRSGSAFLRPYRSTSPGPCPPHCCPSPDSCRTKNDRQKQSMQRFEWFERRVDRRLQLLRGKLVELAVHASALVSDWGAAFVSNILRIFRRATTSPFWNMDTCTAFPYKASPSQATAASTATCG